MPCADHPPTIRAARDSGLSPPDSGTNHALGIVNSVGQGRLNEGNSKREGVDNVVEQYELERPDARIQYWVQGVEGAPTVVFLHGATLDHHAWDQQVEVLREDYRIVTIDLRGHGLSTMEGRFDFEAAVGDVMALLHRLRAAPVALVGLSL